MFETNWMKAGTIGLLAVLVLAGCGIDSSDKRACRDDRDCLEGFSCVDGTCENQGGDAGTSTTDAGGLARGSDCECASPDETCCGDGLFCHAEEACNVETENGCKTVGTCVPEREYGESCTDPSQCKADDARCLKESGCQPPPVGEERCDNDRDCSPGRVCVDSYCLLKEGEDCVEDEECASGYCYDGNLECLSG